MMFGLNDGANAKGRKYLDRVVRPVQAGLARTATVVMGEKGVVDQSSKSLALCYRTGHALPPPVNADVRGVRDRGDGDARA